MAQRIAFEQKTSLSFADAVEHCRAELAKVGFGVISEIDMQAKIRAKLGIERTPYLILGACHPESAHEVLAARPEAGVLLPCNVTISIEDGTTVVRAMDPSAAMDFLEHETVSRVARKIGEGLEQVMKSLPH